MQIPNRSKTLIHTRIFSDFLDPNIRICAISRPDASPQDGRGQAAAQPAGGRGVRGGPRRLEARPVDGAPHDAEPRH